MLSLEGSRHLIDSIFVDDILAFNQMNADATIMKKLRYLENALDHVSPDESIALEHWNKVTNVLEGMMETLSNREQNVLKWRFGLEDGKRLTQREVGLRCGFTAERARQVENKALRKLRHPGRSRRLVSILNSAILPNYQPPNLS